MALSVLPEKVRLAESSTCRAIAHFSTLQPLEALALAFSPDGTKLIASTNRKTTLMWDLRRIRQQLREMDLDWDQPPFPPEGDASTAARPALVRSIRVLGEVLEPQAHRAAEMAALDERLRADPDDADALSDRGAMRLRASRWSEAIADLERGLRIRPDEPEVPLLLAEAYLHANDLAGARAALDRHLARSPDDHEPRLWRGWIALQLGSPQVAAVDFTRVLEADPDNAAARYRRARAWLGLDRSEDALADFDALIRMHPQDVFFLYEMRGEVHERLGRHEEARADRKRAAEMPTRSAKELNGLAWKLATGPAHLRDPEEAVILARKSVAGASASDRAMCLNTLGVALYRAGRNAETIETLERSLAAGEGQSDAFDLYFLAMARFELGQIAPARADFDRAVRWRRGHTNLPARQAAELDAFQTEAQALLDYPPLRLPDDVFAPVRPGRP
jgi:tetratricopeptide (TPR) repeat protein